MVIVDGCTVDPNGAENLPNKDEQLEGPDQEGEDCR